MRYYKIGNDIYQLNCFRSAVTVTYFTQASFGAKLNIKSVKINEPPLRLEETCSICDDLDGDLEAAYFVFKNRLFCVQRLHDLCLFLFEEFDFFNREVRNFISIF